MSQQISIFQQVSLLYNFSFCSDVRPIVKNWVHLTYWVLYRRIFLITPILFRTVACTCKHFNELTQKIWPEARWQQEVKATFGERVKLVKESWKEQYFESVREELIDITSPGHLYDFVIWPPKLLHDFHFVRAAAWCNKIALGRIWCQNRRAALTSPRSVASCC